MSSGSNGVRKLHSTIHGVDAQPEAGLQEQIDGSRGPQG